LITRRYVLNGTLPFLGTLAMPSIIRAQTTPQAHFFAGCYYDTSMSDESMMSRYLIAPWRQELKQKQSAQDIAQDGAEMTPFVRDILQERKDFVSAAGLTDKDEGNAIAISLNRAQHETITVLTPGLPPEYLTIISVSAAFDVMTGQAAFRNQNRLESVYSNMFVVNQVIHGRNKVTDADLLKYYRNTFKEAVYALLERATKSLRDKRERANAVFQVKNMLLPKDPPGDLAALIASGVEGSADKNANANEQEIIKLTREIKHIYSLKIMDALEKAKITNAAILPPESPWAEGRILGLLQQRLGIAGKDQQILTQPDANRMNGYEIRANLADMSRRKSGSTSQVNATITSRIVRVKGTEGVDHMPMSIKEPAKKIAYHVGGRSFIDSATFKRGVTRDITMAAIRDAAEGAAKELVPFIKATANEI